MNPATAARDPDRRVAAPVPASLRQESAKDAARRLAGPMLAKGFKPEALHTYRDADGNPIYSRIRVKHPVTGEKWIRPMHRNGSGFVLGEPKWKGPKPIYNLHRIAKAAPDVACYIVEGEKAADALTRLGVLNTTSGGAESAGKTDWTPLKGRPCVIWPDNDEPGRQYGEDVARILRGLGCPVSFVDVGALHLPDKGDAADWVPGNPGATAADVHALVRIAPPAAMEASRSTRAGSPSSSPSPATAPAPGVDFDGDWPTPMPLPTGVPPVEPFCAELLPDALRGWIMDIAERTQCPPDFAAVGAMVALGSVIGRKVGIRPKVRDDWQECANLWGVIVGPPSVLKSAALREAMAPLRRLEAKALEAYDAERVGWEAARAAAEVKRRAAQQNATQRAKKGESFDADELVSHDAGEEPKPRRFIANDATPEALCEVLRANPNGILAYRDELAGLVRQLDREGMESARAFYLSAFSGNEPYVEDRIGRGTNLRIEAACVSMLGTIQPAVVGGLLHDAIRDNGGDGFLSRFSLLVWPDVSPNWKDVDRWPDSEARRQAFETFARLDDVDVTAIGATVEEGRPPFLRLCAPAREAFAEWRHELEHRLRDPEAESPALVAHLGKYRKLVPSCALICHLADGGTGDVSEMALARALGWSEYLESHARRAYASVQQVRLDGARTLLRRIQRGDVPNPFTRRDVHNKGWSGLATAEAVIAAAEILCDYEWLRAETIPSGGRPKTLYWINRRARP